MKSRLAWKVLAVNLPAIAVVIAVVWLAIDYLAADYFSALMDEYHISPTVTHQMFLDAVHRYLIQATLVALALAAALSYFLTRRVLRPLSQMTEAARRIAAGDYTGRAEVSSRDEVGQLSASFNRMADSLERIERLRRTMIVDLAHELRTPLTSIRGHLEGLAEGVIPPSRATFEMLEEETIRLVRLVGALQRLSRAEGAEVFLRRDEIHLPDLVGRVLELFRGEIEARRLAVEADFSRAEGYVSADRDKLLQVLHNLVENACRYTPPGGRVRLWSEPAAGGGLQVCVENTGEGIPEADLPLVFERFYRADKSRSRESGGAGLGLAIVKGLVEAHGGRVGAESAGGITRLWFTLPAG